MREERGALRRRRQAFHSLSSGLLPSAPDFHRVCDLSHEKPPAGFRTLPDHRRWGLSPRPEKYVLFLIRSGVLSRADAFFYVIPALLFLGIQKREGNIFSCALDVSGSFAFRLRRRGAFLLSWGRTRKGDSFRQGCVFSGRGDDGGSEEKSGGGGGKLFRMASLCVPPHRGMG